LTFWRISILRSGPGWISLSAQLLHSLDSPWTRALNVGYVVGSSNAKAPVEHSKRPDEYELLDLKRPRIYRVTHPIPRFYLASRIRTVANETEALAIAKKNSFDPAQETIVEGMRSPVPGAAGGGTVQVISYQNNRVELNVKSHSDGLLVTSETLYPGWVATVNGRETEILPTNVAFRGVPVKAGEQRVVMEYRPKLAIWAILSAAAFCFALVLIRWA
jgi:hypothetical protein